MKKIQPGVWRRQTRCRKKMAWRQKIEMTNVEENENGGEMLAA